MKKLLKLSIIVVLMLTFVMSFQVFAAEETKPTDNTETSVSTTATEPALQNNASKSSSTEVTSVATSDKGELTLSDIISILLIVTGVVIILLAIAIIVKLR